MTRIGLLTYTVLSVKNTDRKYLCKTVSVSEGQSRDESYIICIDITHYG